MQPRNEVVLVTGASGFIGTTLVKRLAGRYTLVALDQAGAPDPPAPAHAIDLDLGSDGAVRTALDEVHRRFGRRIAAVVHLAAYYDISGEPNPLYDEITVEGTRRLIDALKSFEVGQFVYASTMLVHRPTARREDRIDESAALEGAWPYPESKIRAEELLRVRRGDMPLVILRIAGVYDDLGHSPVLAEQIARIHEHRLLSHVYPGTLCAAQSSIHIEDLAEAVERVIERRDRLPAEVAILLGEPEAPGYDEIQDIVGEALHGHEWATLRIPQPLAKAGAWLQNEVIGNPGFAKPWMVEQANAYYLLDISRARRLLEWEPRHSLRDVLPKMVAALKRDPPAWYRANKLNPALVAWAGERPAAGDAEAVRPGPETQRDAGPAAERPVPEMTCGAAQAGDGQDQAAATDAGGHRARWAHFTNIGLGLWLAATPWVWDATAPQSTTSAVHEVTIERGLPSIEWRADVLAASDVASGLLIAVFAALSLSRRTAWFAQWAVALIGIWLLFAPLVFWSPSAAQYQNDLIVGALVIAFSVLVPTMPGMSMEGMTDPKAVPPGWTYCPSTGAQRLPIVAMGLVGLLIARMLTAYQLGHVDAAWEPFFAGSPQDPKNGTEEIITSDVSKAWPIPDAGLGAVSYLLEILMAAMGSRSRWRTMPWMVTFFGILVIPLGVVSIYFIVIQPIVIGTWSTPALVAALAMLIMIPFALDEVIAMGQYLNWARRGGKPLLRVFLQGGAVDAGREDETDTLASPAAFWNDTRRGITLPWTLAASVAIGVFLMFTRVAFGTSGAMADSDHLVGALAVTVAIIATAEVARALRFVNVAFGAWLVVAPWILSGESTLAAAASVVLGLALIGLSLPRGRRTEEHYASWDRFVV